MPNLTFRNSERKHFSIHFFLPRTKKIAISFRGTEWGKRSRTKIRNFTHRSEGERVDVERLELVDQGVEDPRVDDDGVGVLNVDVHEPVDRVEEPAHQLDLLAVDKTERGRVTRSGRDARTGSADFDDLRSKKERT